MPGMTHDAGHWDGRYAGSPASSTDHLGADPDPTVVAAIEPLPPGWALDLATGLGRHARWLAAHGWAVTAVDFSTVGIARARDLAARDDQPGTPVSWVVADVRSWVPEPDTPPYDLVLAAFVHLDPPDFARIRTWLAPGGHLVVVSHAPDAAAGPRNPAYRYDEQQLRAAAHSLTIERITTQDGLVTLVAHRS